jgi:hypothetical protein
MRRDHRFDLRFSTLPVLCSACAVASAAGDEPPAAGAAGVSSVRASAPSGAAINDGRFNFGGAGGPSATWLAAQGLRRVAPAALEATSAITPGGLVGTNFPICDHHEVVSSSESLDTSSSAYNPVRGEYLVVWHAFDRVTLSNIYGQRVAWNGTAVGPPFAICDAPGVQAAPSVSYEAGTGVFWVAWTDFRNGAGDVYLRRVSGIGERLGSEIVANDGAAEAFAARLACGTGACAVVWASDPHDGNSHVLLRAYSPVTVAPITAVTLLSDPTGHVTEPDVCYNGDDARFMVVWQQVNASMQWDVWSYHLTWNIYGVERKPISTAVYHQQKPRVAYSHGAGRYLAVWEDSRSNVSWDVYGQRLERSGALVGGNQAIFAGPYRDMAPVVAGHGGAASEFLVAFQRDISGALQDQIYACRVSGAGSVGGAFPVREWYNVRSRPGIVHRAGQDDYLVTFTDDAYGTQPDVDAQVLRGSGVLAGSLIVVSRGRKGQEAPAAAYNSVRNEYLPVWADFRDGRDYDLYYWRLGPSGVGIGPGLILATSASLYGDPHAAYNPAADEYMVVWSEVTSPASGFEIYGRRLNGTGAQLAVPILVSRDTAAVNEGRPRVSFNPLAGNYLVVWHAFTGGVWRIWGQRLAANGALQGSNFPISDGAGLAQNPRVALGPAANEYVVVWQDVRNSRVDIYAERIAAGGTVVGGNYPVSTATGDKDKCDIAFDPASSRYLVVWGDTRAGGADVWAQRLGAAGAVTGAAFAVIDTAVAEVAPSVACDVASHEFLVTWWALNQSTDYDVWARRVPAEGLPSVPSFPVSGAMEVQTRADLVQNTNNTQFLVFWQDFRNGSYDIFGQLWMKLPRTRLHHALPGYTIAP